ncbi:hypothetical protein [Sphingopyxis sp.]|uniref:hypothetical protein n=1 Tax=Sphingopyxis sp. TaxID=1908224 RepID=UPI003BAD1623
MLILFGAGVEASDCASACSEPVTTGRWLMGLSLIIFLLPILASPSALLFFRWLLTPLTERKPRPLLRRSILSRLMG